MILLRNDELKLVFLSLDDALPCLVALLATHNPQLLYDALHCLWLLSLKRAHHAALDHLRSLLGRDPGDPRGRGPWLDALYADLGRFVAESLAHMDREERENTPLLPGAYDDAELAAIECDLRGGGGDVEDAEVAGACGRHGTARRRDR